MLTEDCLTSNHNNARVSKHRSSIMADRMHLRTDKRHTIVIYGLGSIGSRLARLIQTHFGYEVIAFRSHRGMTNKQGIPEIFDSRDLEEFSPDIAFITNPTSCHVEFAIECASRGIHLFIEKPLSNSLANTDILLDIIRQKKIVTYVGCNLRFDPIITHLKSMISPERWSHACVICSSYLPQWRPERDYRNSYSARKDLGGGVILDLIHEPDYCSWLFGTIDKIEGTAGKISNLNIETEDFADMVLTHTNGFKSHIHLDYVGKIPQRKIEIQGGGLCLEADLLARTLTSIADSSKGTFKLDAIDRDFTYIEELKYFFDCIENGTEPMNSIEEHLSVLKPLLEFKNNIGL